MEAILSGEVAQQLTKIELDQIRFDLDSASSALLEWKAHIARHVNQGRARLDILEWVKERPGEHATIHQDFIMKFLPTKYREANRDWYAKAGINWHNCAVTIAQPGGILETTNFVHIFVHPIRQASESVTAISKHILTTLKGWVHSLQEVTFSSDCAGTYLTANTLAALRSMQPETGVSVVRYDFTEPSAGKSVCDRAAGVQKSHVRMYVGSCNDVETPEQVVNALRSEGGVLNTSVALADFQEQKNKSSATLPGIKLLRNFQFSGEGLKVWKAYSMGPGRLFSWEDIGTPVVGKLTVLSDFVLASVKRKQTVERFRSPETSNTQDLPGVSSCTLDCEVGMCDCTFLTHDQLNCHMELGSHHYPKTTKVPFDDLIRQYWVSEFGIKENIKQHSFSEVKEQLSTFAAVQSPVSWALQTTTKRTPKSVPVIQFLNRELEVADTRRISIPDLARKMRTSGCFDKSEWLTARQIKAWLGAVKSKQLKKPKQREVSDEDLNDAEAAEEATEHQEITAAFEDLLSEVIVLMHPVEAFGKDLCRLASRNELKKESKESLSRICDDLHVPYPKNASKKTFTAQISQHTTQCECRSQLGRVIDLCVTYHLHV